MNHVYRIVWNQAKSCWQAVCETASTRSKNTSSRTVLNKVHGSGQELRGQRLKPSYAAVLCGLGLLAGTVSAGPTGGQVSAGTASITQSGATTTIQQASQKAAIDWTSFSVGKSESVRFNQPNASAITLNRVTGTERSEILGNLSANGQVFILNPNGVLFGKGAQVNVGGLVASTLRMSNEDFMAGNYKFTEGVNGSAAVVNEGRIQVAEGGVLALIAPVVTNTGTLIAPQGSVLMAGADAVTVTLQDGSLVSYTIDKGNLQALVDNGGLIQAEGGHVVLTAKGLDALSRAVVNHSGVIEAQTVLTKNGIVELLGDMEVGLINMSGKIDASAPNGGDGGFVETSAAKVTIQPDAYITTLASKGKTGKFLLDPTDLTIAKQGGDLTGAWVSGQLARNNVFLESTMGSTSGNGDVFVSDRISWSANTTLNILAGRNIQINAEIEALGSSAGVALTTGVLGGGAYSIGSGGRITLSGANASFALNGTPYKVIRNVQQLQAMKDDLLGNYVLGVDIDASGTSTWNGGKGFQPVGQGANNFMGVLDGLGHQVNGLYINRPSESEVGLIGSMEAMVRNIGVSGANITGLDSVGALAGQLRWGSSVSQSFASGKVTGRGNVGGLIGFATPYHYGVPYWCSQCIAIDQSYADVAVAGQGGVGGLVGTIDQTSITNSYAVGNVSSPEIVGGLVGHNWSSYIVNSYSSGQVQGQASGVGGLVGLHHGSVINSHYDSQTSGLPGGNTTAEMKQQATFVGWDFTNTWRIVEGNSYPMLRALTQGKITLTAAARDVAKVYNKVPWFGGGAVDYSGFTGSDSPSNLSGSIQWGGTSQGAVDAGMYTLIPSGLYSQKYEIDFKPATLYIAPRILDVSASKPYDGSGTFKTGFNVKNVLPGDTVNITGEATVAGVDAGTYTAFTSNTLSTGNKNYTLNPVNTPNYSYGSFGSVAATIDKATISQIRIRAGRDYNGTPYAYASDVSDLLDVLPRDQGLVSVTSGTGVLDGKDVGVHTLTSIGDLTLGGPAAGNYALSISGSRWTISPKFIDLGIKDGGKKIYDGSRDVYLGSENFTISTSAFPDGEGAILRPKIGTLSVESALPMLGIEVTIGKEDFIVQPGTNIDNYRFSSKVYGKIDVLPRPLVIKILPQHSYPLVLGGLDSSTLTDPRFEVLSGGVEGSMGLVGKDSVTGFVDFGFPGKIAAPGIYPITQGTLAISREGLSQDSNYSVFYKPNWITVSAHEVRNAIPYQTLLQDLPSIFMQRVYVRYQDHVEKAELAGDQLADRFLAVQGEPNPILRATLEQAAFVSWVGKLTYGTMFSTLDLVTPEGAAINLAKSSLELAVRKYGDANGYSEARVKEFVGWTDLVVDLGAIAHSLHQVRQDFRELNPKNWREVFEARATAGDSNANKYLDLAREGKVYLNESGALQISPDILAWALPSAKKGLYLESFALGKDLLGVVDSINSNLKVISEEGLTVDYFGSLLGSALFDAVNLSSDI